jgi:hypothetical protein
VAANENPNNVMQVLCLHEVFQIIAWMKPSAKGLVFTSSGQAQSTRLEELTSCLNPAKQ